MAFIRACLRKLTSIYNQPLTAEQIDIYTMVLDDCSEDEINEGFNRAVRERKFWPKPSELLELSTGVDPNSVAAHNARVSEEVHAEFAAENGFNYRKGVYSSPEKPAQAALMSRNMSWRLRQPGFCFGNEPGFEQHWPAAVESDASFAAIALPPA
jgi:hypothetical protein